MISTGVTASMFAQMLLQQLWFRRGLVKRENPVIEITHCCLHKNALTIKVLPEELSETMNNRINCHWSTLLNQKL